MPDTPETIKPTHVLAVDPGLRRVGWAALDARYLNKVGKLDQLSGRLLGYGSFSTDAHAPLAERLSDIAIKLTQEIYGLSLFAGVPTEQIVVVIERPAMPMAYRRHGAGAMANGMSGLYMGIGALAGAGAMARAVVEFRSPNTMSKLVRWERSKLAFGAMRVQGRSNSEERDAISLGVQVLLDGRRKWGEFPGGKDGHAALLAGQNEPLRQAKRPRHQRGVAAKVKPEVPLDSYDDEPADKW